MEQVESDKHDAIQLLLAEPDGPWAYLNERTNRSDFFGVSTKDVSVLRSRRPSGWNGDWRWPMNLLLQHKSYGEVAGNE